MVRIKLMIRPITKVSRPRRRHNKVKTKITREKWCVLRVVNVRYVDVVIRLQEEVHLHLHDWGYDLSRRRLGRRALK